MRSWWCCSAIPAQQRRTGPTLVGVNRSKGTLLLGLWVILSNLLPMLSLRIPNTNLLLTILGVVAGVLLLVDR
jgi:hypothetical protein